jgi:hypothetical protein
MKAGFLLAMNGMTFILSFVRSSLVISFLNEDVIRQHAYPYISMFVNQPKVIPSLINC